MTVAKLAAELAVRIGVLTLFPTDQVVVEKLSDKRYSVSVPGKIEREYKGVVERSKSRTILSTNIETAVASVVAAEMTPNAPLAAMQAIAVLARSFYAAGKAGHKEFDFCDTTHCQFLRAMPEPHTTAAIAAQLTKNLIVSIEGSIAAVPYSASCGGRTRAQASYRSVECQPCQKADVAWETQLPLKYVEALDKARNSEQERLRLGRELGWSALPSSNYTAQTEARQIRVTGRGKGHGVGVCQMGAIGMAADGADFRTILQHYVPNARIRTLR